MSPSDPPALQARAIQGWLLGAYVLFVVYGSLVPLQYVDRPWGDALEAFKNTPWLELGAASRADWVANGVLYLPVGYLAASWLALGWVGVLPALAFSVALAVSVEFAQLFFPQRTVSLNDLLAEGLGSLLGVLLATRFRQGLMQLMSAFFSDAQRLRARLLQVYVLAYLALAFFPFDLLLSRAELVSKSNSSLWGWWLADASAGWLTTSLRLLAEVVLAVPLGLFWCRLRGLKKRAYGSAVLSGLLLGGVIELGQFLIYSGVSQGLSVLTRGLGVGVGAVLYQHRQRVPVAALAMGVRRYSLGLFIAYVAAWLLLNGVHKADWQEGDAALRQLAQLHFLPFYYQYFTTEAKALGSVMAVSLLYAPLGVLAWARRSQPWSTALLALLLAMGMEAAKLFMAGHRPDPTHVLLAGLSSGLTHVLLRRMFPLGVQAVGVVPVPAIHTGVQPAPGAFKRMGLLAMAGVVLLWLGGFPVFQWFVLAVLAAAGVLVWHRPATALLIIALALPVFDLAPWSGRFFLDEFDALLGVCLGVALARVPRGDHATGGLGRLPAAVLVLVVSSFAISAGRGLLPLHGPDANAFNNYYSAYNALRIFKGVLWGLLVLLLFKRLGAVGIDGRRPLATGMAAGLGLTVAFIVWERAAFSGLWDFTGSYRVTGPFSAMHTGGAYIECFLAMATPFLCLLLLERRPVPVRLAGLALLLASTYALMVTFSRNGYLAFAVAVAVMLLTNLFNTRHRVQAGAMAALLAGTLLGVAWPIFEGDFAQARMATVRADLAVRQAHWREALQLRDTGWPTALLGMGLGRYPETNYFRSTEARRPGSYRLAEAQGNTFLRLGSGNALYVEQRAAVVPGQTYRLTLDVRPRVPNATITLPVCEKWLLTSFNCAWQSIALGPEFGTWRHVEADVDTRALAVSAWFSVRPVKLSLYVPTLHATLDIDNVRLLTGQGVNLLRNGDFSGGLDHWFFSTDDHLHWHVKSLFYGVLFDQGWFGLLGLVALLLLALGRAARQAYGGDVMAGAYLAALSSFVVLGLFDTLVDAPRFLMLLVVLAGGCLTLPAPRKGVV